MSVQKKKDLECLYKYIRIIGAKNDHVWALILTGICGMFSVFQPLYSQVDNYMVSLILNRCYDADVYCMFLNPVLCFLCGVLQKLFPQADVFTLLTRIMILLGIYCIGYVIAKLSKTRREVFVAYVIIFILAINASLFFEYFTVWAAFFSVTGMVLLLLSVRVQIPRWITFLGWIFVISGMMWREEVAAIFLPFYLLDFFVCFKITLVESRKEFLKKYFKVFMPVIICVIILETTKYTVQSFDKYAYGIEYNNTLGNLVDYPMEDYDAVAYLLPGVSENDYNSLQVRLLADTDRVDAEYGAWIESVGRKRSSLLGVQQVIEANIRLFQVILTSKRTMFYCMLFFLFMIWNMLSDVKFYSKLELLCAYFGAYLIMFFFSLVGRIPLRIIDSVIYAVWGILLVLFFSEKWESRRFDFKKLKIIIVIFVIGIACMDTLTYDFVKPQSVFNVKEYADEDKWSSTYTDEQIFIWQTNEFVQYPMRDFMNQGKLMTEEFMRHNLCYGEWTWGQVYYINYLERFQLPNPMKALLEREETYLVAEDHTLVSTYIKEHYDENVIVQKVDEIDGIPVWEFQIL